MQGGNMRIIKGDGELVDWPVMEKRLRKIEDTLASIQTVVYLMLDLLESEIPVRDGWRAATGGDDGQDDVKKGGHDAL
jgi:hypothetical protein